VVFIRWLRWHYGRNFEYLESRVLVLPELKPQLTPSQPTFTRSHHILFSYHPNFPMTTLIRPTHPPYLSIILSEEETNTSSRKKQKGDKGAVASSSTVRYHYLQKPILIFGPPNNFVFFWPDPNWCTCLFLKASFIYSQFSYFCRLFSMLGSWSRLLLWEHTHNLCVGCRCVGGVGCIPVRGTIV
jgi:hypothetical protein